MSGLGYLIHLPVIVVPAFYMLPLPSWNFTCHLLFLFIVPIHTLSDLELCKIRDRLTVLHILWLWGASSSLSKSVVKVCWLKSYLFTYQARDSSPVPAELSAPERDHFLAISYQLGPIPEWEI